MIKIIIIAGYDCSYCLKVISLILCLIYYDFYIYEQDEANSVAFQFEI